MPFGRTDTARSSLSLTPGRRVRIRQKVTVGLRSWPLEVTGTVTEVHRAVTGIHTDRVVSDDIWVEAIVLKKDDGELTRITLDEHSQIEVIDS